MILVYTPGCWDLFHVGHLQFLERAKALGDRLVVGVASDVVVGLDKGRSPVIPQQERQQLLEAVWCVSVADIYHSLDFIPHLCRYRPEVLVVGPEWGDQPHHKEAEDWLWREKRHGRIIRLARTAGVSTTSIKERVRAGTC